MKILLAIKWAKIDCNILTYIAYSGEAILEENHLKNGERVEEISQKRKYRKFKTSSDLILAPKSHIHTNPFFLAGGN